MDSLAEPHDATDHRHCHNCDRTTLWCDVQPGATPYCDTCHRHR